MTSRVRGKTIFRILLFPSFLFTICLKISAREINMQHSSDSGRRWLMVLAFKSIKFRIWLTFILLSLPGEIPVMPQQSFIELYLDSNRLTFSPALSYDWLCNAYSFDISNNDASDLHCSQLPGNRVLSIIIMLNASQTPANIRNEWFTIFDLSIVISQSMFLLLLWLQHVVGRVALASQLGVAAAVPKTFLLRHERK